MYIQKSDIFFLMRSKEKVTSPVLQNIFKNSLYLRGNPRYEFISIEDPEMIPVIAASEHIVDYDAVKDLTPEELLNIANGINEEICALIEEYNSLPSDKKSDNQGILITCEILRAKILSYRDLYWLKEGKLCFTIPEDDTPEKENIIKRFFINFIDKMKDKKGPKRPSD